MTRSFCAVCEREIGTISKPTKFQCPRCQSSYCKDCCSKVGILFKKLLCPQCGIEVIECLTLIPMEELYEKVSRCINPREDESILDAGCGKVDYMPFPKCYRVGLDIWLPYLREKRKYLDEVIQCDLRHMPLKKKSFDIVVCVETLEHLPKEDGARLLETLQSLARREIILSTPKRFFMQPPLNGNPYQVHLSTWGKKELEKRGYNQIETHEDLLIIFKKQLKS